MGISKEFKLAIIQAFYANGKSRIATKRILVYHTEWGIGAKNMRFWGETNPHETIEGPKSKERVIAWVGLSYECGVIGPFFFEDTEGKSDTVKTANYLEMIKKR